MLTKRHRQLKDEAVVGSVRLAAHADALHASLERLRIALRNWARSRQKGLHLLGRGGHLTVVRVENPLELSLCLLLARTMALSSDGFGSEEGSRELVLCKVEHLYFGPL